MDGADRSTAAGAASRPAAARCWSRPPPSIVALLGAVRVGRQLHRRARPRRRDRVVVAAVAARHPGPGAARPDRPRGIDRCSAPAGGRGDPPRLGRAGSRYAARSDGTRGGSWARAWRCSRSWRSRASPCSSVTSTRAPTRPGRPPRSPTTRSAPAFGPGANGPFTIVVQPGKAVTTAATRAMIQQDLHAALAGTPDVAAVSRGPGDERRCAAVRDRHAAHRPAGRWPPTS